MGEERWIEMMAKQLIFNFFDMKKGKCSKECFLMGLVMNLSKLKEEAIQRLKEYIDLECDEKFLGILDESIKFIQTSRSIL